MVELVQKRKVVWEMKTTSDDISPGGSYWRRLQMDPQIAGYLLAEPDAEAVVYDVLKKTTLNPTGKGTETEQSYFERIRAQLAKEPEKFFQRGILTRTEKEIDEYREDMVLISAAILQARKHGFPRHVSKTTCNAYFSDCDYMGCCSGTDEITSDRFKDVPRSGRTLPLLSHSAAENWRTCPRKFYYSNELRRRPVAPPSHAMSFGTAMHKAIQAYHNPKAGFGNDGLERALWVVEKMEPGHDRAHARALVHGYYAMYAESDLKLTDIERWYEMPLVHPRNGKASESFNLGGSIDAVGEMP